MSLCSEPTGNSPLAAAATVREGGGVGSDNDKAEKAFVAIIESSQARRRPTNLPSDDRGKSSGERAMRL